MPTYLADGRGKIDDSRSLLEKMRRRELEAILANEGIPHPKDVPATVARDLIRGAQVRCEKYLGPRGEFLWPEKKSDALGLYEMNMAQLRSQCTALGVGWSRTERKSELREKIEGAMNGNVA